MIRLAPTRIATGTASAEWHNISKLVESYDAGRHFPTANCLKIYSTLLVYHMQITSLGRGYFASSIS